MSRKTVIAVIGAGTNAEPGVSNSRKLGRMIAENGWVLITGGRDAGVMKAASEGAKEANGLTIGILPDRDATVAPAVDVALVTDVGQARNNIIVLSADVVIACGVDGAGTASEVSLALKAGKPVILIGARPAATEFFHEIGNVLLAESPEEAIGIVEGILPRP